MFLCVGLIGVINKKTESICTQKLKPKMQLEENSTIFKSIPPFLCKLWKMVNDPTTDHLISWSENGSSFIIYNRVRFFLDLLPLYYRHSASSSFIRQLHMYHFQKVFSLEGVGTKNAAENALNVQYQNQNFRRNQPERLINIKRYNRSRHLPKSHNAQDSSRHNNYNKVVTGLGKLRNRQLYVDSQLLLMKNENAVLWKELVILRQKHRKQQQIVNKVITFLNTLVQQTPSRIGMGINGHMPLMSHENSTPQAKTNTHSWQGDPEALT